MSKDNSLHNKTHFKRTREVIAEMSKNEGIDISEYDTSRIKVYETIGQTLRGKNVRYNIDGGYSCWVGDNKYHIFEVPSFSNETGSPYGEFVYLAYNVSYDYYLFGQMQVMLDESRTISTKHVSEKAYFINYGKYSITFQNRDNHIRRVEKGKSFDPGTRSDETSYEFDSYNSRKQAYGLDRYKILKSLGITNLNSGKLSGEDNVKIYKKKTNSNFNKSYNVSNNKNRYLN
jgi:hypothetical protein